MHPNDTPAWLPRVCEHCGKEFKARRCHVLTGRVACCSPACRKQTAAEKKAARLIERACLWCDKQFNPPRSNVANGQGWYCSQSCSTKARNRVRWGDDDTVRFWSTVDRRNPDDCWLWTGSCIKKGYGSARVGGRFILAHRAAWELTNGPITDGLLVLHKCEGRYPPGDITCRRCCNPAHLKTGTNQENIDMTGETGRRATGDRSGSRLHPETRPRGEQVGRAVLTTQGVVEIQTLHASGAYTYQELGAMFGVSRTQVGRVVRQQTWKHLYEPHHGPEETTHAPALITCVAETAV